jgi:hypothetical protein
MTYGPTLSGAFFTKSFRFQPTHCSLVLHAAAGQHNRAQIDPTQAAQPKPRAQSSAHCPTATPDVPSPFANALILLFPSFSLSDFSLVMSPLMALEDAVAPFSLPAPSIFLPPSINAEAMPFSPAQTPSLSRAPILPCVAHRAGHRVLHRRSNRARRRRTPSLEPRHPRSTSSRTPAYARSSTIVVVDSSFVTLRRVSCCPPLLRTSACHRAAQYLAETPAACVEKSATWFVVA